MDDFQSVVGRTPQQAVNEWLEGCRAKVQTYANWPGEMRSYGLMRRYYAAFNRAQQQEGTAARREALLAQWQAEDATELPGGADAWERLGPHHGQHKVCGVIHQFTAPCPP